MSMPPRRLQPRSLATKALCGHRLRNGFDAAERRRTCRGRSAAVPPARRDLRGYPVTANVRMLCVPVRSEAVLTWTASGPRSRREEGRLTLCNRRASSIKAQHPRRALPRSVRSCPRWLSRCRPSLAATWRRTRCHRALMPRHRPQRAPRTSRSRAVAGRCRNGRSRAHHEQCVASHDVVMARQHCEICGVTSCRRFKGRIGVARVPHRKLLHQCAEVSAFAAYDQLDGRVQGVEEASERSDERRLFFGGAQGEVDERNAHEHCGAVGMQVEHTVIADGTDRESNGARRWPSDDRMASDGTASSVIGTRRCGARACRKAASA